MLLVVVVVGGYSQSESCLAPSANDPKPGWSLLQGLHVAPRQDQGLRVEQRSVWAVWAVRVLC